MTTPCSGTISLNSVRTELGLSGQVTLNDAVVRDLAGVASGRIDLQDLYCKTDSDWLNINFPATTSCDENNTLIGVASGTTNNMSVVRTSSTASFTCASASPMMDGNTNTYYRGTFPTFSQNWEVAVGRRVVITGPNPTVHSIKVKQSFTLNTPSANVGFWISAYMSSSSAVTFHLIKSPQSEGNHTGCFNVQGCSSVIDTQGVSPRSITLTASDPRSISVPQGEERNLFVSMYAFPYAGQFVGNADSFEFDLEVEDIEIA